MHDEIFEVKQEAQTLLRQTKKPTLQPKALEKMANTITKDAKSTAGDVAVAPQTYDEELSSLWNRIEARGEKILDAADKEAITNVLVARTDLTKAEAAATVARWQATLSDAKAKFVTLKANAEQKLRQAADSTAELVSKAAAWSFVGLLIGLIAAVVGGYFGSPLKGRSVIFRRRVLIPEESAA